MQSVLFETDGPVCIITINQPAKRNAVDGITAAGLRDAFRRFEGDDALRVAVLTGAQGTFCAGADLSAVGDPERVHELDPQGGGTGPMGPSRMALSKPLVAAVEGHAVAGGLELALLADMRVAAENAVFGVFCRRWGVPLIDGGTVRLPRLVGHSRALDMILTGREVGAREAFDWGLANRLAPEGQALTEAKALANVLAKFPQTCLRSDRQSSYEQWALDLPAALVNEARRGIPALQAETRKGAARFAAGKGRGGDFGEI